MGLIYDFLHGKQMDIVPVTSDISSQIAMNELAFDICKNLITNSIVKCEILEYKDNKRIKTREWYRWNVSPNVNQNATDFWDKLLDKLFYNGDVLVVPIKNELYVADSFSSDETAALYPHSFSQIQIDGMEYKQRLTRAEVFYFKLHNKKLKELIDNVMFMYGKLISVAYSNYLASNGNKGFLKISSTAEGNPKYKSRITSYFGEQFKKFFGSDNAIMPLYDGFEFVPYKADASAATTRDIKALSTDILELYANAFGIPKVLVTGDVQDTSKAVDQMLTFCVDPLIELLQDEINRQTFTVDEMLNGTYIRFDTNAIKHIDLLDVSTAIDKLISSGFMSINDLRRACHMDTIDEPWADAYFMTKNYSPIEDLLNPLSMDRKEDADNEKMVSAGQR